VDFRTSQKLLAAVRDGRTSEAIDLARGALAEDATDIEATYHLADSLQVAGEYKEAQQYSELVAKKLPTFESLLLAVRCAKGVGSYDQAYIHAKNALNLMSDNEIKLSKLEQCLLWFLSWVPGFRGTRNMDTRMSEMR
jgi:Tfp pilus assembly protein PilF